MANRAATRSSTLLTMSHLFPGTCIVVLLTDSYNCTVSWQSIGAIALQGSYTEGVLPTNINDLNCTGSEDNVLECPHNGIVGYTCNHYQDAAVICQGNACIWWRYLQTAVCHVVYNISVTLSDIATLHSSCMDGEVRLVGGTTVSEGTVEICFNNAWGTICHSSWGSVDANVICKQLGYQPTGSNIVRTGFESVLGGIL